MSVRLADWFDVYDAETREPTEAEQQHTAAALLTPDDPDLPAEEA